MSIRPDWSAAAVALTLLVWSAGISTAGCFDAGETVDEDAALECGDAGEEECGGVCVDTLTDPDHCGACDSPCESDAQHTEAECVDGQCETTCEAGWVDEDDDLDNGCEYECEESNDGVEICDGEDNDCDGEVDEEAEDAETWYLDEDGDGFGTDEETKKSCEQPDGYADEDGDCDDEDPEVHPNAEEVCGDDVDNDCDGKTDDETASDATDWFADCDGDGFAADSADSKSACEAPSDPPEACDSSDADWTDVAPEDDDSTDCNDAEPDAFPGQDEWFEEPMEESDALQTDKWDYDCNGQREEEETVEADESCNESCGDGWVDPVPSCGVEADFQSCFRTSMDDPCGGSFDEKIQRCR
ncbi:MAG: MopE-related protein [Persicimonas sp.]